MEGVGRGEERGPMNVSRDAPSTSARHHLWVGGLGACGTQVSMEEQRGSIISSVKLDTGRDDGVSWQLSVTHTCRLTQQCPAQCVEMGQTM